MTGVIASIPKFQFSGATGAPLASGTLETYIATTTTLTKTWQDQALTIENTNPIVLDASGSCVLWLSSTVTYKFILKNSLGVVQWTQDNITTSAAVANTLEAALAASGGSALVGFLQAGTGAVARTVQNKARESVSVDDFGAVGDGSTDDTAAIQAAITAVAALGGGEVHFSNGKDYKCLSTIVFPSQSVTLVGTSDIQGGGAKITSSAANVFSVTANISNPIFAFASFRNLTVWGAGTNNLMYVPAGPSWAYSRMEGCYFLGLGTFDVLMTGTYVLNNNFQNIDQVIFRGGDFNVHDNYFGNKTTSPISASAGLVEMQSASNFRFVRNYISSFAAPTTPYPCIINLSLDFVARDNWIDGGSDGCLKLSGGTNNGVVSGNRLSMKTGAPYPCTLSNLRYINFSDNNFQNMAASQAFIKLESEMLNVTISDNLTNERTDTTLHDVDDDSVTDGAIVRVDGVMLQKHNFTGATFILRSPRFRRVISNSGGTGNQQINTRISWFKAGDWLYVANRATRMIVYDVDGSTTLWDSDVTTTNFVKLMCYSDGVVTVEGAVAPV